VSRADSFGHFIEAQDRVYANVLIELRQGRKTSHWMWFIFPQIAGLGSSPMAQRFALHSLAEAAAFAAHPILGPRLVECTSLVNRVEGASAHDIFGSPDDRKFRSSMTLFAKAVPTEPAFAAALAKYYAGRPDGATLARL
jgi:uncharacterized protein (DUF1810 family)